ncbi:kinase-like domain-containing protein [Rhizophagus clarus]|uniref:Kinase-like domain-containing protein n=1 Tax=Rhizophagus clarus TaxID=94130 RepID=A0A8H3Q9T4_9GLOM|nr:kinase-like domain-containing protein [Rhizophagus clarus]
MEVVNLFSINSSRAFNIIIRIVNGKREEPIENIPLEYLRLYQKCLQDDLNIRPDINEIYEILSKLKLQINNNNNEKLNQISYDKEEWVGDAVNDNLMSWTSDFNLFQINLKSSILKSLKPYLDDLKISNLLMKKRIIEENDLYDWIQK